MKNLELLLEKFIKNPSEENYLQLLNALYPILGRKIKQIYGIKKDYKDVFSEGVVMLLEAIPEYIKGDIKIPFVPYITSCIRFFSLDLWKKRQIETTDISYIDDVASDEDTPEEIVIKKMYSLSIFKALNTLPYIERDILVYHYLLNKPLKTLASNWDIPYSTLLKKKNRALKKMKKYLEGGTIDEIK